MFLAAVDLYSLCSFIGVRDGHAFWLLDAGIWAVRWVLVGADIGTFRLRLF